jgi:hypothetical protein
VKTHEHLDLPNGGMPQELTSDEWGDDEMVMIQKLLDDAKHVNLIKTKKTTATTTTSVKKGKTNNKAASLLESDRLVLQQRFNSDADLSDFNPPWASRNLLSVNDDTTTINSRRRSAWMMVQEEGPTPSLTIDPPSISSESSEPVPPDDIGPIPPFPNDNVPVPKPSAPASSSPPGDIGPFNEIDQQ